MSATPTPEEMQRARELLAGLWPGKSANSQNREMIAIALAEAREQGRRDAIKLMYPEAFR